MATSAICQQISFSYRNTDSPTGVTRETAQRLAKHLGVDESQAIHLALRQLASKVLPQYESDDGPLKEAQVRQIKKAAAAGKKNSVRSNLLSDVLD